jgi:fumarate reductase subunit D
MKKFTSSLTLALVTAVMPLISFAQGGSGITGVQNLPEGVKDFGGFIKIFNTLINWIFTILLILAVFFILWAAFKYLTAGGDNEKIGSAHKILVYAVVAIAVALLAQGVRFVVAQLVGVSIQNAGTSTQQ